MGELSQRLLVAAVGIPLALLALYAGGLVLAGLLALIAAGSALELYSLAERTGSAPFGVVGALAAASLVVAASLHPDPAALAGLLWTIVVLLSLGLTAAAVWLRGPGGRPLASVAVTVFGAIFCGGTLAYALFIRNLPAAAAPGLPGGALVAPGAAMGMALLAFPIAVTWINDSCAYFAGRRWGKRKLMPAVSPAKTVVGSVAGFAGGGLVGAVYSEVLFSGVFGLPVGSITGGVGALLIIAAAQTGDLAESLLKREVGVKDSGALLPGHGGLLDRFDALFLALPVAYWFFALTILESGPPG